MKVAIKTYGCRVNQADSQKLLNALNASGFQIESSPDDADLIIVNGCVVTEEATREALKYARKIAVTGRGRGGKVILTGCHAKLPPHLLRTPPEGVVVKSLDALLSEITVAGETLKAHGGKLRTRALLKVQEGCDHRCTFCIVPFVRGRPRSIPPEQLVRQVKEYEKEGVKEIVLTGTHLASYGRDTGLKNGLHYLLNLVLESSNNVMFRLSSLDPHEITDELLKLASSSGRVCPHLHLSVQSGSNEVLKKMRRAYRREHVYRSIEVIRKYLPEANVGADVIVGFPGESEDYFEETVKLISEAGINYLHVFPFSPRPMTEAWHMAGQVSEAVKKARAKFLRELDLKLRSEYIKKFKGRVLEMIVEKVDNERVKGTTPNYLKVVAKYHGKGAISQNQKVAVRISGQKGKICLGKVTQIHSTPGIEACGQT